MKQRKLKMIAGTSAMALLAAGTCISADVASAQTTASFTERAEGFTNFETGSETVIVFQKQYDAYQVAATCSTRAAFAEVTIETKRPFTFLETGKVLYDQPASTMTISLPLTNGAGSWVLPANQMRIAEGVVVCVTAKYYTSVNGTKVYDESASGSVSLCGCESLQDPAAYDAFYVSGICTEAVDYADVTLKVNRLANQKYKTVNTASTRLDFSGGSMTSMLDSSKLNFAAGDVIVLDYTFYRGGQKLTAGNASVALSNTPGRRRGDLDGDGVLTKNDSVQLIDYLSGNDEIDSAAEISLRTADLNNDGRISSKDLNILKKMVMSRS
ncbi:MAG TPA: hypothetical protein DCG49_06220 [Ruminococcus sp.]|nr:hypothetical protein [Ruminococcus sp.]